MNDVVKEFISTMRTHHGFREFLKFMEKPPVALYRPGEALDIHGARSAYSSGQIREWERWQITLTQSSQIGE